MGTYEDLKTAIQQVIRTNGNNEITGALLQQTLLSIVNSVGANAAFAGIATPDTNPGTADQNVFYLATEAGMYANFGGIEITEGEAVILSNKSGNWVKTTTGFATQQQLEFELIFNINDYINDYTPFSSRGSARARAPYTKIGHKGLIIKYLTIYGWVIEMQITDNYSSNDSGWTTIYNGNDKRMKDMATDMFCLTKIPLFQHIGGIIRIYEPFNVFSSTRSTMGEYFKTIQPQDVQLPGNTYWSICVVYDLNKDKFESELKSFSLISSGSFVNPNKEDGKYYIPVLWCLADKNDIITRDNRYDFYPKYGYNIYNSSTALALSPYRGIFLPLGKVNGVLVNMVDITNGLSFYKLNIRTKTLELIKTFSSDELIVGIQKLMFDNSIEVGGFEQIVFSGQIGYIFETSPLPITPFSFYPNDGRLELPEVGRSTLKLGIVFLYGNIQENFSEIPSLYSLLSRGDSIATIPTPIDISLCTNIVDNIGYVGQFIGGGIKVTSIDINVRDISEEIKIITYDLRNGNIQVIKRITATSIGIMNVTFDTPIECGNTQLLVHGKIGYAYRSDGYPGFVGANIDYYYNKGGFSINEVAEIAWGIKYNIQEIAITDYIQNLAIDYYKSESDKVNTIVVDISDYDNNLRNVFDSIQPNKTNHYIITIPEGIYNVKSWYSESEINNENLVFRGGLKIPNYVKLMGVGSRENIILEWDNSNSVHLGNISVLNPSDWCELENLTVIGNNIRYAVHDDFQASQQSRYIRVKNCDFQITDGSRAWGAGHNGGYDGEFIDCKFSLYRGTGYVEDYTYIEAFLLHDNTYSVGESYLLLDNCRFYNEYIERPSVGFGFSTNEYITRVKIVGCKMNTYINSGGSQGINNGRITGYANVCGSMPRVEDSTMPQDELIDILWTQSDN